MKITKELQEFIDMTIQERMQSEFKKLRSKIQDKENEVEEKYLKAISMLPPEQKQAVRDYCDAIFDNGAETEVFFYRLGLKDGMNLKKMMKKIVKSLM